MEVVIVILALIYSVWSEIQKKKQEEDANIDFSELTTLDDFFKTPGGGAGQTADIDNTAKRAREKRAKKKKSSGSAYEKPLSAAITPMPARGEVNYDQMPSLESKGYESSFGRVEVNYDELPALVGRNYEAEAGRAEVNYDAMPTLSGRTNYEDEIPDARVSFMAKSGASTDQNEPRLHHDGFKLSRQDLLKSFVLSEVLQRYDINRIYERIPGIRSED
mgnify:FL=1